MNLPNFLTLFRIIILFPFVMCFYSDAEWAMWSRVIIFAIACITDYLDGFLARAWHQASNFGRFLDPIADKLLIGTTVLMLAGTHVIHGVTLLPAVVILCREILVSGLREFLMEVKVSLPVSRLAKWKTGIQMVALGFLLNAHSPLFEFGIVLFWLAGCLTLLTGYDYFKASIRYMKEDA